MDGEKHSTSTDSHSQQEATASEEKKAVKSDIRRHNDEQALATRRTTTRMLGTAALAFVVAVLCRHLLGSDLLCPTNIGTYVADQLSANVASDISFGSELYFCTECFFSFLRH